MKDATVATGREVGDKTEDAAEAVGDKTVDAAEGLAETTADATITSAVKMKFAADKIVEAFAIDVDTKNGVVTLTGSVKSKSEADRAVMLAKGVEGVKSVTPNLTISTQ